MNEPKKPAKTVEEIREEIQGFFKEKFGADIFTIPLGNAASPAGAQTSESPPDDDEGKPPEEISRFSLRPTDVKAHLDRYVIGQDEAKRTLAVAVCDHYNHVQGAYARKAKTGEDDIDYVKQNVILLGPTGVGKTYLIRILAQLIGVPFVKADITKFSETGYVGGDVEDLVRELYRLSGKRHRLASHGIIFLDEIDKIASAPTPTGRDPSGRGVQVALLKLMEDTEVSLRNPFDLGSQFQDLMQMRQGAVAKRTINTRHVLFVVSGAFSGLHEIVEKRLSERNVGFASAGRTGEEEEDETKSKSVLARASTRDFIDYGFEPEFIGRLPVRVALDDLDVDELFDILRTSEGSILQQYYENFRGYSIEVAFADGALRLIAQKAHKEKTGARGLMTVLESCLRDFKFYLPSTAVRAFAVTARLIEHPALRLEEIIRDPDAACREFAEVAVREFEGDFARSCGVRLLLDDAAIEMALNLSREVGLTLKDLLWSKLGGHRDFLKKITETAGTDELAVTPHILNQPAEGLERWLHSR
ncbi:MAG: AAA family ATPase [Planctomycetes bacterium]|nr:AAA family ATPase [Planctomycetota bacterium]